MIEPAEASPEEIAGAVSLAGEDKEQIQDWAESSGIPQDGMTRFGRSSAPSFEAHRLQLVRQALVIYSKRIFSDRRESVEVTTRMRWVQGFLRTV